MSDRKKHERYRGGGREGIDRRPRADQYGTHTGRGGDQTTAADRVTAGMAGERGTTGERQYGRPHDAGFRDQSPHRNDSASRRPPGIEGRSESPSMGGSTAGTPPERHQSPGERRGTPQGRSRQASMDGRDGYATAPDAHERSTQPYELPTGERGYEDSRAYEDRQSYGDMMDYGSDAREPRRAEEWVGQRRPTWNEQRRSETAGSAADRRTGDSGPGGGEQEQPRDPKTGRFLPKGEQEPDESRG